MSTSTSEKVATATHLEDPEMDIKKDETIPTGDYSGAVAKDDPVEVALVRKLDMRIMPTLWCMYFMNYVCSNVPRCKTDTNQESQLDRNAIANSRLDGLEKDLGLHGSQYNTCISILFVGYVAYSWALELH
jgi:hypothetical protein